MPNVTIGVQNQIYLVLLILWDRQHIKITSQLLLCNMNL